MGLAKVIAVDFDDTIHSRSTIEPGKKMGPPVEGAREALKGLKSAGHVIVIFSVRGDRPGHIQDWMRFHDIPFDHITNIKLPCDVYVDDRAVAFRGDWKKALKDIDDLN